MMNIIKSIYCCFIHKIKISFGLLKGNENNSVVLNKTQTKLCGGKLNYSEGDHEKISLRGGG